MKKYLIKIYNWYYKYRLYRKYNIPINNRNKIENIFGLSKNMKETKLAYAFLANTLQKYS